MEEGSGQLRLPTDRATVARDSQVLNYVQPKQVVEKTKEPKLFCRYAKNKQQLKGMVCLNAALVQNCGHSGEQ